MIAPDPKPIGNGAGSPSDIDKARALFRETLRKINDKKKTGRLNEDSKLFRLQQKLTTIACSDDAERRQRFLEEAEADADA